jgi:hypothetical protein
MTKEDRARIARQNGAKSKGPRTDAGKSKSARNAIKDGTRAQKYAHFVPPHEAVLCIEDKKEYERVVEELMAVYKPQNQSAFAIIADMAAARWQIYRLNLCITMHWNLALLKAGRKPSDPGDELHQIKIMVDASTELLSGNGVLSKLNREIARLQQTLSRSERRIKFIHANFPDFAPGPNKRTEPEDEENITNEALTPTEPENNGNSEPPVFTTENVPEVIAAYKREFPGRRIVIVPSDNPEFDEKMPPAPRKVA